MQLSAFVLLFSLALLIPVNIGISQTVNEESDSLDVSDITPNNNTIGPLATVNELYAAQSKVTERMIDNSEAIKHTGYGDEELYLEAVYVDEQKQTLVIWLEPIHTFDPVDTDDLQEELGLGIIPVEIIYGYYISEALPSQATSCPGSPTSLACYYWSRYVQQCLPTHTHTSCSLYGQIITVSGYSLPTLLNSRPVDTDRDGIYDNVDQCPTRAENKNGYQDSDGCPDTPPASSTSRSGVIFQDNFENGLGKWTVSGQREWQTGTLDESAVISGYTTSNKVAEADDCDDQACILSMRSSIDLSRYSSAKLEFDRFVDTSLDAGEYLAVQVGNNGAYTQVLRWTHGSGDDDRWHHETVDLGSYLRSGFNVRFVTEQSSSLEDVAIDNVKITASSTSSPQCTLRVSAALQSDGSIRTTWNSCSGVQQYKVYASENGGSNTYKGATTSTSFTFSNPTEGKSYVMSVRAQKSDNTYTEYFTSNTINVPVPDRTPPVIITPGTASYTTTNSTGGIVYYPITATDTNDGTVDVSCNPKPGTKFPVGSTRVTCSATDKSGNTATARFTITLAYSKICTSDTIRESGSQCLLDYTTTTFNQTYIYGGQLVIVHYEELIDGKREGNTVMATATIGAELLDGTQVLVGVGHMVEQANPAPDTKTKLKIHVNQSDIEITNPGLRNIGFSPSTIHRADAIYVKLLDGFEAKKDQVITKNGTIVNIIGKGGLYNYGQYPIVDILGSQTNSQGSVSYVNVTTRDPYGILIEHAIATYNSVYGDSGAPIIHYHQNGTANLFGQHVGKLCAFSFGDDPHHTKYQAPHDSYCDRQHLNMNVFTPWENVDFFLGLK